MSLLVVGSIALDRLRMPGGKVYDNVLGGSCSYFARAAANLVRTRVVGVVGGDFGPRERALITHRNIDLRALVTVPDGKTFRWVGTYAANMNDRTTDDLQFGVLGTFRPVVPPAFRTTPLVFLACAQPSLQLDVLAQTPKPELAVGDTIEIYIQNDRRELDRLLRRLDGVIVNDREASLMFDDPNPVRCAVRLLKYGLRFAVVKKGEHGGLLAVKGGGVHPFPAVPLEKVADPTGAGDAFAGGFMGYLAKVRRYDARHLRRACAYGVALATFACEGVGLARLARTTAAEVRARTRAYAKLVQVP